jgi:UDP-3-O-[3-hydroxymyristoyl] N-acetylglucosamine deacetylase
VSDLVSGPVEAHDNSRGPAAPVARRFQRTLAGSFSFAGPGLHTGGKARVVVRPAPPDAGRIIQLGATGPSIPVQWRRRVHSPMNTALAAASGEKIRTIEHLMAALSATEVDNVRIEVDGPEIPIRDGGALGWLEQISAVGLQSQAAPRTAIEITEPVQICRDGGFLRAEPYDGFAVDVTFDDLPRFGLMRWAGDVSEPVFRRELAASRSFGRPPWRWLDKLAPLRRERRIEGRPRERNQPRPDLPDGAPPGFWERIEAERQSSLREKMIEGARPWTVAVVIGPYILGGGRWPDEPVRHVALDMIGDLALFGRPIRGRIFAHNPAHEKNYALVSAVMAKPTAHRLIVA